jgi:hypothetical protein
VLEEQSLNRRESLLELARQIHARQKGGPPTEPE